MVFLQTKKNSSYYYQPLTPRNSEISMIQRFLTQDFTVLGKLHYWGFDIKQNNEFTQVPLPLASSIKLWGKVASILVHKLFLLIFFSILKETSRAMYTKNALNVAAIQINILGYRKILWFHFGKWALLDFQKNVLQKFLRKLHSFSRIVLQ
jgi:hypothetical protein